MTEKNILTLIDNDVIIYLLLTNFIGLKMCFINISILVWKNDESVPILAILSTPVEIPRMA